MSRIFPILLIVIATTGVTYFLINVLLPYLQIKAEYRDDELLEQRFFGWGSSQTVEVNLDEIQGDLDLDEGVKRVQQNLQSCSSGLLSLSYGDYNSLTVAIDDEDFDDGQCSMAMRVYAAKWEGLDCTVPREALDSWDGWKNRISPDTSQIRGFCKVVSSIDAIRIDDTL